MANAIGDPEEEEVHGFFGLVVDALAEWERSTSFWTSVVAGLDARPP
jgi:hypothetical protein